eukprot:10933877-Ditylum_brightwellii.AAC.1
MEVTGSIKEAGVQLSPDIFRGDKFVSCFGICGCSLFLDSLESLEEISCFEAEEDVFLAVE